MPSSSLAGGVPDNDWRCARRCQGPGPLMTCGGVDAAELSVAGRSGWPASDRLAQRGDGTHALRRTVPLTRPRFIGDAMYAPDALIHSAYQGRTEGQHPAVSRRQQVIRGPAARSPGTRPALLTPREAQAICDRLKLFPERANLQGELCVKQTGRKPLTAYHDLSDLLTRRQPHGHVDMTITTELNIVKRLLADRPSFHLDGEARWDTLPGTLEAVHSAAENGASTIEVGVGVSTVVFAASGAYHTAISPDPSEHERVRSYCRQIGVDDSRVSFVVGLSDEILPSLLTNERTLDVALIDGAHSFPFPVVDWYYVTRSLKVGGKLFMDDIPIPVVAQVFRHMKLEPNWRLDGVFDDRAAAFTLLAPPDSADDWPNQPFNNDYPDFSFAGLPKRVRLRIAYLLVQVRHDAGQRYPSLRRIYKRST